MRDWLGKKEDQLIEADENVGELEGVKETEENIGEAVEREKNAKNSESVDSDNSWK